MLSPVASSTAALRTLRGAPAVRLSFGLVNRVAMSLDMLAVFLVALGARAVVNDAAPLSWPQTAVVGIVAAAAFALTQHVLDGYRVERYRRWTTQATRIVIALVVAAVADRVVVWSFAPVALTSNAWLLGWTAATLAGVALGRTGLAIGLHKARAAGALRRRVAVVGANPDGLALIGKMRAAGPEEDYAFVGLYDDAPHEGGPRPAGNVEDLRRLGQEMRIDLIVIALPWSQPAAIFAAAEQVQWLCADVVVMVEDEGPVGRASLITSVAGAPAMRLSQHPLRGSEGLVKLAQDYAVAGLAVLIAAPVMALSALAVRLSGPGPILFRQARVGFNGRPFTIYKFRTMTVDPADDGSMFKQKGDPRITRIGAILRQTSLDELPQLFNVVAGDMSIVGPRPHVPNMLVGPGSYAETVRAYAGRHQIKPGITGWAQVNGMRGGIDTVEKARQGVELDLYYLRNLSLILDLKIMWKTLTRNMAGRDVF